MRDRHRASDVARPTSLSAPKKEHGDSIDGRVDRVEVHDDGGLRVTGEVRRDESGSSVVVVVVVVIVGSNVPVHTPRIVYLERRRVILGRGGQTVLREQLAEVLDVAVVGEWLRGVVVA